MHVLSIRTAAADMDLLVASLFEIGVTGFEERDEPDAACLLVYSPSLDDLEETQRSLEAQLARSAPLSRRVTFLYGQLDDTYQTAWKAYLKPEWLTEGIVLAPVGAEVDAGAAQLLRYEPVLAFGTGSHPTTRLAARSVAECVGRATKLSLLDVGTGNGVLALVALVSGAAEVFGVDIDPDAVRAACHNAALNGLAGKSRFETTPLDEVEGCFDIVVANIDALTLRSLGSGLVKRTKTSLVVTGILLEQRAELEAHLCSLGMRVRDARELDDWCLMRLEPAVSKADPL